MSPNPDQGLRALLDVVNGVFKRVAQPRQVLGTILKQAVNQTGARRGVFVEVTHKTLTYRVLHEFDKAELANAQRFSRTVFAEVLRTGASVMVDDAMLDDRFASAESVHDLRMISVLCMPIEVDGRIRALVHLERDDTPFTAQHRTLLRSLLDIAGPVLETLRAGHRVIRERAALQETATCFEQEIQETRETLSRDWSFGRFLGRSRRIQRLDERVRKAADTEFPVLVLGETGTGKSLVARIIHASSARSNQAFVTVFCPSMEKGMVESELFGHRRGAFTGAEADRVGKVQVAAGGTLFFDEVGELPLGLQPKLLRLLQEGTYERVGGAHEHTAEVRVIAATNRDLAAEVESGRFRRDLFERLRFVPIEIPPLRERREDIPMLFRHCLDSCENGRWIDVSDEALVFLERYGYDWPGNVREVEQLAARTAMEGLDGPVSGELLERLLDVKTERPRESITGAGSLRAHVARAEREFLAGALEKYPQLSRSELADRLEISERTLFKKLREYDLT